MKQINTRKGFGIVEVLIASTIIVIVLGALVFLGKSILDNVEYTAQKHQAINVGQQVIESIRQRRDTNYLDGNPATTWSSFLDDPSQLPRKYTNYKIIQVGDTFKLIPIDGEAIENFGQSTLNNANYYYRVQITKVETGNKCAGRGGDILNCPQIKSNGEAIGNIPAYVVSAEVFWQFHQTTDELNDMRKIEVSELITDFKPKY